MFPSCPSERLSNVIDSAQSAYNLRNPPKNAPAQTCQFYNTYAMYKNDVYQGQYCTMYNQTWDAKYATNTGQVRGGDRYTMQYSYIASNATNPGQCPQPAPPAPTTTSSSSSSSSVPAATPTTVPETRIPIDLRGTQVNYRGDQEDIQVTKEANLFKVGLAQHVPGVSTRIYFPVIPNELYEISFEYFQEESENNDGKYYMEIGDHGYEAVNYWSQVPGTSVRQVPHYSAALSDGTGAEMDACFTATAVPKSALPPNGVWNTGRVILKPRSAAGFFRWDVETANFKTLAWRNMYVTKLPSDFCKQYAPGYSLGRADV
ncbi:MAG: hypothetical protein Q9183_004623 [Haloplaca sp. 2 TL-2023]